jgi:two-component system, chemotaxis family, chemotaxis protein CheY
MEYKNVTALIIDDVSVVRQLLIKELREIGFEHFYEAADIDDAWFKINNTDISLVFSDWNMPNGDGIDLLDKVRSSDQEKLKYLKFVMVTGAHDKAFLAMDSGAHNIIHKPFNKINILRKLELLYRK